MRESLADLFPSVKTSDYFFDLMINNKSMRMGIGVHDSSAALMPYLVTCQEPFLLLSTGTWNVCFNPFNDRPLTKEELAKDCLSYLTFEGRPVKASRIFLGHEHEIQQRALAGHFNVPEDRYKTVTFNEQVYRYLSHQNNSGHSFHPLGMEGSGPIPEKPSARTDYSVFENFEVAQHQLIHCLVRWQKLSIDLVDPDKQVKDIIVVGGFTKGPLFLEILKRELQDRNILISDHPRAAALGAGWLVHGKVFNNGMDNTLQIYSA